MGLRTPDRTVRIGYRQCWSHKNDSKGY